VSGRIPSATVARRRARVTEIVRALPGAAVEGERHLGFSVRGRRFAWYVEDHHGDGRVALHCKALPGVNRARAEADPERFHVPPYVGSKGWLGIWLDGRDIDWEEVEAVLHDAYRLVGPVRLDGLPGRRTRATRRRTR